METKEWRFEKKESWGAGPWQDEPDKIQFTDPETGLPCLIHRGGGGSLCGYVGVAEGHKLYGVNYAECSLPEAKPRGVKPKDGEPLKIGDKEMPPMPKSVLTRMQARKVCDTEDSWCDHRPESILDAHGGITFSDFCAETRKDGQGICHLPSPGEPEKVWWFGFDCGHAGDVCPSYDFGSFMREPGSYKDIAYVRREIAELAKQIKALV